MALLVTTTLSTITCCQCSMLFGVPARFETDRRRDHKDFFCPAGHRQHYPQRSDLEIARDEAARAKHAAEQASARAAEERNRREGAERQLRARKAVATRLRNKIAAGRCPCCSHQFKDLRAHMRTEHPQWNPERGAEALAAKGAGEA